MSNLKRTIFSDPPNPPKAQKRPPITTWRSPSVGFDEVDWYVVYAKPGQEAEAAYRLSCQAYAPWLPLCAYQRSHGGKVEVAHAPMFSRYLFVGVVPGERVDPILSTVGVADVIRTEGGRWLRVRTHMLAKLQAELERQGGVHRVLSRLPRIFTQGEVITLSTGPLSGLPGKVVFASDDRITLMLDIFGRPTPISVPTANVSVG